MTAPLVKLSVFLANGAVFTDLTQKAYSFIRDTFTMALATSTDYLYLGRPKSFNTVWVEINTPSTAAATLSAEYWNGTAWTALPLISDETNGFTRSGFLTWDKAAIQDGSSSEWKANEVNSLTKYWIRVKTSVTLNPSPVVAGIGLVFASDSDMKEVQYDILSLLPKDETATKAKSFISAHVAAKEMILTWLKEANLRKFSVSDGNYWEVDEWDFHNPLQVRTCAKYLALHIVHRDMVVEKDDRYDKKAKVYLGLAKESINLPLLSLDINDDGYESVDEKSSSFHGGILSR